MESKFIPRLDIKIHHLQLFLVVVEEMSFSRAAEQLNMAQPPLSRQIQRLESNLGIQLFDRTSSQICLTEAGEFFSEQARNIVGQIEEGLKTARCIAQGKAGSIIFGIDSTTINCDQAVSMIVAYRQQYPEVNVQIRELSLQDQLKELKANNIDVGFTGEQFITPALNIRGIVREPLVVALPRDHALAERSQISLAEITDEPVIMNTYCPNEFSLMAAAISNTQTQFQNPQLATRHLNQASELTEMTVLNQASDTRLILSCVASGLGVAILPASVGHDVGRHNIVYCPVEPVITVVSLSVIWRRQDTKSTMQSFLNMLGELNDCS